MRTKTKYSQDEALCIGTPVHEASSLFRRLANNTQEDLEQSLPATATNPPLSNSKYLIYRAFKAHEVPEKTLNMRGI